jgi:glutathione synthase/RimK-type ligase-like ATP-grasp enzyme
VDKKTAFEVMRGAGVPVPDFKSDKPTIRKGDIWFARTMLRASGGEGIVVLRKGDSIPDAPLYVRYVRKSREFRVHVVNGQVIFCQEKKRSSSASQSSDEKLIRNYDNGWVFCLVNEEPPAGVKDAAMAAVAGLGLDFGAVDIVVDRDSGKPFVLECNTAPGLSSPTLINAYKEAFTTWLVNA